MRLGSQHAGKIWKQRFHSKINWLPSTCKIFAHFGFVWNKKTRAGKLHDHRDIVFEKLRFQNVFHPHSNAKPAFFYEQRFRKLQFREGLVRTVDLTRGKKLRFQISFPSVSTEPDIFTRDKKCLLHSFGFAFSHAKWFSHYTGGEVMAIFSARFAWAFLLAVQGWFFCEWVSISQLRFSSQLPISCNYEDCHSWPRPQSSSVVW